MAVPVSALAQATADALEVDNSRRDARDPAKQLDTVVVTATRRSEPLQDVPISVTAMSQDELDAKGIVGYEGLAHETPGVVLNRASANFNNFTARGIATNGYNANLQSTVAIYVDELPISANGNSTILDPSLYDVERVEFLRGPQGTLFGSGSLAGALRILTHAPDPNVFEGSVLADVGITGSSSLRQRYNAMLNVPLVEDRLALRVVGFSRDEEGYIDNAGTGIDKANALESWGGRATLLWEPTDRMSLQFRLSREESTPKDSSLVNPDRGEDTRYSDRPDLFSGVMTTQNVTLGYQFDSAKLTSSSTWSDYKALFNVDLAGTYGQAFAFALDAPGEVETFVQEVRLVSDTSGPLDWVLGGFYYKRDRDVHYGYRSNEAYLAESGITGLSDVYYLRYDTFDRLTERALFGQLTYRFTDDVWTTVGLRYGSTEAQGFTRAGGYGSDYLTLAYACSFLGVCGQPVTIAPVPAAEGAKAKESGPSYRVSASWRPTPSITTYAAVATGFRAPVVNARAGSISVLDPGDLVIPAGADSDELISYELGMKGRWLGGRLTANLALFQIDWNDIQVQANRVSDQVQFATNIGGAYSRGLEFEFMTMPNANWTIALNGAFNRARVDTLSSEEAAVSGAVMGARLSGPEFSGSLTVNYGFDAFGGAAGNASLAVVHVGGFPASFPNVPGRPGVISPTFDSTDDYTLVNASVAAAFDRITIGLYAENLFDDRSVTYVHPEAFIDSRYGVVRPRTVGVRLGYRF
ncbi:TonB-dependent receptor [Luteimonas sp. S4-F44]|uniref:TonB-dependent receptor n=1 Tax=Luteimonas sp. S4-F44 TaxID=2925842 RepID=UPI001F53697F|nr:TonB-dependent receptor [Luteimonas sp. S4-F44]UNK43604.1 TonB-dependent receptor [Luteimonas sp. S4-F44]